MLCLLQVLIYSGQLDIIVALPLTEAMLQTVPWKFLKQYQSADRVVWKVNSSDTEVAGYVRNVKDFYQVILLSTVHVYKLYSMLPLLVVIPFVSLQLFQEVYYFTVPVTLQQVVYYIC